MEGVLGKFGMSDAWPVYSPATEAINTMGPYDREIQLAWRKSDTMSQS